MMIETSQIFVAASTGSLSAHRTPRAGGHFESCCLTGSTTDFIPNIFNKLEMISIHSKNSRNFHKKLTFGQYKTRMQNIYEYTAGNQHVTRTFTLHFGLNGKHLSNIIWNIR